MKSWEKIDKIQDLSFHNLTVTQISFSPDKSHLLTVSRDRSWCLFKRKGIYLCCIKANSSLENNSEIFSEPEDFYEQEAFSSKTNAIHKRQLHCCAWTHDSKYFATGSRDGKLVIWGYQSPASDSSLNGYSSQFVLNQSDEDITSVSFAPMFVKSDYLFVVGFGSGRMKIYRWSTVDKSQCHDCLTLSGSYPFTINFMIFFFHL